PGAHRQKLAAAYCCGRTSRVSCQVRTLPCCRSEKGIPVFSTNLSTRSCDGRSVVALRGELDMADAVAVADALTAAALSQPQVIVDLAGLEFIDSSEIGRAS